MSEEHEQAYPSDDEEEQITAQQVNLFYLAFNLHSATV